MTPQESPFDGPRYRRGLLAALLVAISIPPLATLAIALLLDGDEVTAWLAPRLSGALNREVTIGDAGVAFLPRPGLRLSDVRVGGAPDVDLPSVVAVRDVHLEAALLPLFTGRVQVDRLRVDGLDVHLAVTETGVSNFGDLVPEARRIDTVREGPVAFAITTVEVDDASLTWFDGVRNRSFAVAGGSADLGVSVEADGSWAMDVDGRADSLHVRMPDVSDEILRTDAPTLTMRVRGDGALDWVEIDEGTLAQWDESVELSGRIEGLSDVDPTLDLRFSNPALDLGVLTRLVPPGTRATRMPALEGALDVKLTLRGALRGEDSPALGGSLGLAGVGLRLGGVPLATGIYGRLGLRLGTLRMDSITGTFADGPFSLSGQLDRRADRIEASVSASPDLDAFDRLGLAPFGSTLAGDAMVRLDLSGPLGAPDSMRVQGSLEATGVQLEHDRIGVPLYAPSLELEVSDSAMIWTEATILVGNDPLIVTGRVFEPVVSALDPEIEPHLEATVSGERLDLGALLPPPEGRPDVTYARIALAHLGGRDVSGHSALELVELAELSRPDGLPLRGSVVVGVDRLLYGVHDLSGVSAELQLSDTAVVVERAGFRAWGGSVRGTLRVGVGPRVDEPFVLDLETDSVDAPLFFTRLTPVGETVSGRLDVALSVEGTTDRSFMPVLESLRGQATLSVVDGEVAGTGINLALADFLAEERWRSVPFTTWTTEIAIQEGMLEVLSSELEGERASATLSGAVGLGGAVDLAMALSIPPGQLEAVSLRRTGVAQTVLDRLRETDSSLDLGIRISGTLEGPTLEPDALAATERLAAVQR